MRERITLRTRIYIVLISLVFITVCGGMVMVWYTCQTDGLINYIDKNVEAFQTAEALEIALVNQKGFVSYYFLDSDPQWLEQLSEYRKIFKKRLDNAYTLAGSDEQLETVRLIESEYIRYTTTKDQVIAHYKAGERELGTELHKQVRSNFFKILELSESYKNLHLKKVKEAEEKSISYAKTLRIIAGTVMLSVILLGLLLTFILINQILIPIRKLALKAGRENFLESSSNEIKALGLSVTGLIADFDQTHTELKKSREHLLQAEKMVLVGKLAAGMAHSIRNPLTSVNMRLFSLSRTLNLIPSQKEDFDVISSEIRHIDQIVQNFLEFSRPPKLKMQQISPSEVVDMALQLLKHRLKSYDVEIKLERRDFLPEIQADPEQLKEVFVNIIINACEAMERGGLIIIREEKASSFIHEGEVFTSLSEVVRIFFTDTGPGISKSLQKNIFEPFFTTKDDGTGLGMSIASRIIKEHGGEMDVRSGEGKGCTFIITLPIKKTLAQNYKESALG